MMIQLFVSLPSMIQLYQGSCNYLSLGNCNSAAGNSHDEQHNLPVPASSDRLPPRPQAVGCSLP